MTSEPNQPLTLTVGGNATKGLSTDGDPKYVQNFTGEWVPLIERAEVA